MLHLLRHSAGWDHRLVADPLYIKHLRSSLTDPRQRAAATKNNIVLYMMNQTLHHKPGKSIIASPSQGLRVETSGCRHISTSGLPARARESPFWPYFGTFGRTKTMTMYSDGGKKNEN